MANAVGKLAKMQLLREFYLLGSGDVSYLPPMKRWTLIAVGWLTLVLAIVIMLYQVGVYFVSPTVYTATTLVGFTGGEDEKQVLRGFVCNKPSFLYSTNVMYPVCDSLDLVGRWGKEFGYSVNKNEVCMLLFDRTTLIFSKKVDEPIRIGYNSLRTEEAIEIVNAITSSLTNQLARLNVSVNGSQNMWVENATKARRILPWMTIVILVKILAMIVLCGLGAIIIWYGRLFPPPIPMTPKADAKIISKY